MPATLRFLTAAALLHEGMPPADGIYWMQYPGYKQATIAKVETITRVNSISRRVFCLADIFGPDEMYLSLLEVKECRFWGPITPPDELSNAENLLAPSAPRG